MAHLKSKLGSRNGGLLLPVVIAAIASIGSSAAITASTGCSGSSSGPSSIGSSGSSGAGPDGGSSGGIDGGPSNDDGGIADAATDGAPSSKLDPPAAESSKGAGGPAPANGALLTEAGITFRLIVPSSYAGSPTPLLVVYSGTEGGATMTSNLVSLGPSTQTASMIRAVLDGVTYNGNGQAGATVLDVLRSKYNVDNDRTYLIGESAGTTAALKLGFHLRQSYFAAYWANDVNATDQPGKSASAIGFAPHGQVGPGGAFGPATEIIKNMKTAGYRVPTPAPYSGPGYTVHGDPQQFIAALTFLVGKTRQ